MKTKHPRRRAFPVISSLQYKFLAMSVIYSFIIICFFSIAMFLPDMIEMRDLGLSLEARGSAANRVLAKHTWVWPASLSLIIVLGLHSFRAFLKIIGPLYRFRRVFEQLGKGNLPFRVNTRENDYLNQEEKALNDMLEVLRGKLGSIKEASDGAFSSMEELEKPANKDNERNKSQNELLRAHREYLETLAAAINFFQLEAEE
jgi:methyl-accepting chemotaxis protein